MSWNDPLGQTSLLRSVLGKKTDVVTIFHILALLGLMAGALCGLICGSAFGVFGCFAGFLAGGLLGFACGSLPGATICRIVAAQTRRKSTDELRASLRDSEFPLANFVIPELRLRRADQPEDLDIVLNLLCSIHHSDRCRGWAAMLSAYPELVRDSGDYAPVNQMSEQQAVWFRSRHRSLTVAAR